jgi:hypothetical protein
MRNLQTRPQYRTKCAEWRLEQRCLGCATKDSGSGGNNASVSTMSMQSRAWTNNAGESHCFHCGKEGHWERECPLVSVEQQEQLYMTLEGQERVEQEEKTDNQFLHVSMMQTDKLPDDQAYLDGCSRATSFKTKKYLNNLRRVD